MKFLTDFELRHLEHASLRVKYRELQREFEKLTGIGIVCAIMDELEHGYGVKELESYGGQTANEIAAKLPGLCELLPKCNCVENNNAECEGCVSDEQVLEDTQKRVEQSIARDTAKGINGYGD